MTMGGFRVRTFLVSLWILIKTYLTFTVVTWLIFIIGIVGKTVKNNLDITPYERGFFCNDDSIKYPIKSTTVSTGLLVNSGFAASIGLVLLIEIIHTTSTNSTKPTAHPQNPSVDLEGGTRRIPNTATHPEMVLAKLCWRLMFQIIFVVWVYVVLISITVEFLKLSVGRLRPSFIDVCRLEPETYDCSLGYVTNYTCMQTSKTLLNEGRKSFPSYHAACASYHAAFIILYLNLRVPLKFALLRSAIQGVVFCLACYVSITRLTDHAHHSSDIIAGAALGAVGGVYAVSLIKEFLKQEIKQNKHTEKNNTSENQHNTPFDQHNTAIGQHNPLLRHSTVVGQHNTSTHLRSNEGRRHTHQPNTHHVTAHSTPLEIIYNQHGRIITSHPFRIQRPEIQDHELRVLHHSSSIP